MKPFLLDVNVLLALLWPAHVYFGPAQRWFDENRHAGVRTCPITQAGFLRITCNPRYGPHYMTLPEAQDVLASLVEQPEHEFWPADLEVSDAIEQMGPITGHQQITDAYLVALSVAKGGILATFDRGVLALPGARGTVELMLS